MYVYIYIYIDRVKGGIWRRSSHGDANCGNGIYNNTNTMSTTNMISIKHNTYSIH